MVKFLGQFVKNFKNKLYSLCLDKLSDVSQDEKNE